MTTETFPGRLLRYVGARLLSASLMCLPAAAWALPYCLTTSPVISMKGTQSFNHVAGVNIVGQQIGEIGYVSHSRVFDGRSNSNCRIVEAWATSIGPAVPGMTYEAADGKTYPVYKTDIDGIGYVVGVAHHLDKNHIPLLESVNNVIYRSNATIFSLGFELKVIFVTTGPLKAGMYNLSNVALANLFARVRQGSEENGAHFMANVNFEVLGRTCRISNKTAMLKLPSLQVGRLLNTPIGTAYTGAAGSEVVSIDMNCDHDMLVHATISDANNPSSLVDYLSNSTGEGMAEGVGVALYHRVSGTNSTDWTRAVMGPDSSAATNPNSFYVDTTPSTHDNRYVFVKLRAEYLRQANSVSPGKVNAVATMTLSYR